MKMFPLLVIVLEVFYWDNLQLAYHNLLEVLNTSQMVTTDQNLYF